MKALFTALALVGALASTPSAQAHDHLLATARSNATPANRSTQIFAEISHTATGERLVAIKWKVLDGTRLMSQGRAPLGAMAIGNGTPIVTIADLTVPQIARNLLGNDLPVISIDTAGKVIDRVKGGAVRLRFLYEAKGTLGGVSKEYKFNWLYVGRDSKGAWGMWIQERANEWTPISALYFNANDWGHGDIRGIRQVTFTRK